MATETLEDNKPPLQDPDESPPKPQPDKPENEVADESKPKEEEEAAAEQEASTKVVDSDAMIVDEENQTLEEKVEDEDETKEIEKNEEKDAEEDVGEGEDEGEDEEEDEAEEKTSQKKSKKEAASEEKGGKDPVTPTSDRPVRERKTVERFSVPSPSKSARASASKALIIEKGRGTDLKDIPNVVFKLSKRKPDENLHILHTLLFGKRTKAQNLKRNIGQFSGYVWAENEEKQRAKVKERIDKCVKEKLFDFCDVLNIPINKGTKKEELSAKLLEFLESPHVTTDVLLAEKEQKGKKRTRKATPSKSPGEASTETSAKKGKKRTRKATPSKSPGEASTETSAKKQKQTSQSGKKRKHSSDVEEDDKAELSDAKDEFQEDDVSGGKDESDDEKSKPEDEEDKPKATKHTSKKSMKESSVAKAGPVKKTPVKGPKSSGKSSKKSISKKAVTENDSVSASLSKSKQPASKKQRTPREKQESKGKVTSKSQKTSSIKDQGKGKSNKKAKVEPTREEMHAVVVDILKEVDFNTATLSDILRQLGTHFGVDLMHRKAEVKDIITDVINNMSDEEDEGEEAENDDDDGDANKEDDEGDEDDEA